MDEASVSQESSATDNTDAQNTVDPQENLEAEPRINDKDVKENDQGKIETDEGDNHKEGQHADQSSLSASVVAEQNQELGVSESQVDPAIAHLMTSGFVERFLPGLQRSRTTVDQIRSSQIVLLETVSQEIAKFKECQSYIDVETTMGRARHYHNKLLRLRREMTNIHERSKKLKKRALKLQQQKQSEQLTRAHTREHEMERERMLTARIATSPESASQS